MDFDLALIWAGILAFAVLVYVALDGFDLGIGILFPFFSDETDRNVMMNSIAPVWDGNETWLVLGGGGLFAVFPLAYSVLMPAFYPLVIVMLLGLVFRGVAFEYRFKTRRGRFIWDWSFFGGSLAAALAQGIMLGTLVQGVTVEGRAYAGGWLDWLTPFTLFCGLALVIGYVLLGSTWLIMKTGGELQKRCFAIARVAGVVVLGCVLVVSIWVPLRDPVAADLWFTFPASALYWSVPVILGLLALAFFVALTRQRLYRPYLLSLSFFLVGFAGFAITSYPYLVPRSITIWQAAAPESSMIFILVGSLVLIPLILAYSAYSYWVFRGKVDPDEGYH